MSLVVYKLLRLIIYGWAKIYWRLTIEGREHIPKTGAYVVAPVHRSNVDTPVTGLVTRRRLRYIAKDSLWKYGVVGAFISAMGGFPVRRGTTDREALQTCIDVVSSGEPLVMFPEGTRREGPVIENLFHGPAFVASHAQVPVVPVGIGGSERTMPRGAKFIRPVKIHVIIGPPLQPPAPDPATGRVPRDARRKMTIDLQDELQRLFDRAQARVGGEDAAL